MVKEMRGEELNVAYFQKYGFSTPLLFKDKTGLGKYFGVTKFLSPTSNGYFLLLCVYLLRRQNAAILSFNRHLMASKLTQLNCGN